MKEINFDNGYFPVDSFEELETPFYYYDLNLLNLTLKAIKSATADARNFMVHYAVKANANHILLQTIGEAGLGADCVSGGEIEAALEAGIPHDKIVYTGVGKTDKEINIGLDNDIYCFNIESVEELEVINALAKAKDKKARIAIRINPEIGAHTHANITTGLAENKFGIAMADIDRVIDLAESTEYIEFIGLHFHIGSQILDMDDFKGLCDRINDITSHLESRGILISDINVGGGLGIDYEDPDNHPIPDFEKYFAVYRENLRLRPEQTLHFELGRAVVGQCGSLISRVVYVKQGSLTKFAILDAGMTDLIRPALYQAHHLIQNISSRSREMERYDVVGPICESSDIFGKDILLPLTRRGDFIAIRSAGAYGEVMASCYNCRPLPGAVYSE
ncbi:MAG: diaminopimelate decarboxylase [Muribaculaceae bacterium]|nr:diaminopimelate decarboxylase [Muribaculaceae bacterium]